MGTYRSGAMWVHIGRELCGCIGRELCGCCYEGDC